MLRDAENVTVRLADYREPDYAVDDIDLVFALAPNATIVTATSRFRRRASAPCPLVLDGERLDLVSIACDGAALAPSQYRIEPGRLVIDAPPDHFALTIVTRINPAANSALEGLYMSAGRFCTQCEAEGFRAITYALDRPDCLARYAVRIEAESKAFPTLLSNGNLVREGAIDETRHYAEWRDPFPKPPYLFALVAGDFDIVRDEFVTMSGRRVALAIHVDRGDGARAHYAMDALKRAMAWDEAKFGREYDLDIFNIVAVRDFNFGAMENKGLNVFNSALILADGATATDHDFEAIEAVVGHEYFHNWTGNRITCRDWFQLCLKEGLTVFREQEFSADQRSRAVQRIKDVKRLRARQFSEDAGPLAHPVRPSSYQKIDNFYTATVYEKGGEVIRMLKRYVGDDAFARGMNLYFERCDGTAATVEDFIACFAETSGQDLSAFMRWYDQAGTPHVSARGVYDEAARTYTLTLAQETAPTPGQPVKRAVPIPLRVGLTSVSGEAMSARLRGDNHARDEHALVLDADTAEFVFEEAPARPIPALLRGFSAPVRLDDGLSLDDRLAQMTHDRDPFTRWEAGQTLARGLLLGDIEASHVEALVGAFARELDRAAHDPEFAALALRLPDLNELIHAAPTPDPDVLFNARQSLRARIAAALGDRLAPLAFAPSQIPFSPSAAAAGVRALKSVALDLLAALGPAYEAKIVEAFSHAATMTEQLAALDALGASGGTSFDTALETFYAQWRKNPLVIDKWFAVQAGAARVDALARVQRLRESADFEIRNPNRVRALAMTFAARNLCAFHAADGSGYAFLASLVKDIDPHNPALAARLMNPFESWRRFDAVRQEHARAELAAILAIPKLSGNTSEIVERALA